MIGAIADNNTFLAALFGGAGVAGPLAARRSRDAQAPLQKDQSSTANGTRPVDTIEISDAGLRLSKAARANQPRKISASVQSQDTTKISKLATDPQTNTSAASAINSDSDLSQEEQASVRKLKESDREVRRHEQAHKSAAGGIATGGPTFEFKSGADGQQYAVGGEVNIDTSPVSGDPQATIRKMQQVRRAALAPASPSGQDRAVASQAAAAEQKARAELAKQGQTSSESTGSLGSADTTNAKNADSASPSDPNAAVVRQATGSDASATQISTSVSNRASEIVSTIAAISQVPKILSSNNINIGRVFDAVA